MNLQGQKEREEEKGSEMKLKSSRNKIQGKAGVRDIKIKEI